MHVPKITQPKERFLSQKLCPVACLQTDKQIDRQTDTHTDTKVGTEDTLSWFQECFLRPIIKDRSNINASKPDSFQQPARPHRHISQKSEKR